ncbi:hypothetical protein GCM10027275_08530 [Rhabdobacter roseus]
MSTKWQLVGFGDSKDKIRKAERLSPISYTVVFTNNGLIEGHTASNYAAGEYALSSDNVGLTISRFFSMTEANEVLDGPLFLQTMPRVNSYSISEKGLKLNYDRKKYLLFQPVD